MGNILSGEEKASRYSKETRGKTLETWTDEDFGYPHISNLPNRRGDPKHRKVNFSFHGRYGKSETLKPKSHSLDAIIEELYLSGTEESPRDRATDYKIKKTFIPRIKLTRSVSSLKEEKRYKQLFKMSAQPEMHHVVDSENSTQSRPCLTNEDKGVVVDSDQHGTIYSKNDDDLTKKPDENYFTKNFDECMKRLQLIEKEHEMIEKDDDDDPANIQWYFLREKSASNNFPTENLENEESREILSGGEKQSQDLKKPEIFESSESFSTLVQLEKGGSTPTNAREVISQWYNNLKHQFEKSEEENQEDKTKEMSCRITGATLKNLNETQKPENKEKDTRHYFSRLVKSNKSLIDEELPDPDKVKNIRAMFQENLNSTLKRKLNKKLGGSLQNIDVRTVEQQQMARPLSAQCNRDEIIGDIRDHENLKEKQNKDSESKDLEKEFHIEAKKKKLFEKYEKELKIGRDLKGRKSLQTKWTDTGSMSSGVSSDLSSYDTDVECFSREGTEQEPDELTISDDDLLEEGKDKHYVQNEILEKIRSFGTSVTYYGGEMITCSVGPLLSPTTQAIMEEIGVKYGQEASGTRSFEEFYRKYVETNEPNRKKKLGRARSFGQNDVFQKPNVLNNREIEMYKNDLEIEIGIKKPSGIPLNGLKPRLVKSHSVGSPSETSEKLEMRSFSQPPVIKIDAATEDASVEDETNAESKDDQKENESKVVEEVVEEGNSNAKEEDSRISISENDNEIPGNEEKEILEEKKVPSEKEGCDALGKETKTKDLESASKEILFGYEKSCFNGKPKPDMEFEEFEVCQTVTEKLEKLQELNSSGLRSSTEHNEISNEPEISPEVTSKVESVPKRKWNINLNEETGDVDLQTENEVPANADAFNNEKNIKQETFYSNNQLPISESNHHHHQTAFTPNYAAYNHSRWPIETTVMVDIQKNNEQTPKLLTNGKTVAKTKIRLF